MNNNIIVKYHYDYLDGWRGIAILMVLIGHFTNFPIFSFGGMGVELFFVLSGRLMAEILFIKGTSLKEFYRRRLSRIFPALFVFVFIYFFYYFYTESNFIKFNVIIATLLFYSNYLTVLFKQGSHSLEHTWSLAIEEHGYIILSLIMLTFKSKKRYIIITISLIVFFSIINGAYQTYYLEKNYFDVYWRTDVHISSILMSAAICVYLNNNPTKIIKSYLLPIGIAGLLLNINSVPHILRYSLGTFCFAIVVNCAADLPKFVLKILSFRPFVILGIASYSIYLWQQPFMASINGSFNRTTLLTFALVTGFTSYYLVEKPSRRWINSISIHSWRSQRRFNNSVGLDN